MALGYQPTRVSRVSLTATNLGSLIFELPTLYKQLILVLFPRNFTRSFGTLEDIELPYIFSLSCVYNEL